MHLRLLEIFQDVKALIHEFQPDALAVEKLFFGRNVTTAISVGQARGAILIAAAQNNLQVAEYTPAEIKQAIAGYGNAEKRQIQEMVARLLDLSADPAPRRCRRWRGHRPMPFADHALRLVEYWHLSTS